MEGLLFALVFSVVMGVSPATVVKSNINDFIMNYLYSDVVVSEYMAHKGSNLFQKGFLSVEPSQVITSSLEVPQTAQKVATNSLGADVVPNEATFEINTKRIIAPNFSTCSMVGEEIRKRENMQGRFYIPDVDIDVACFNGQSQEYTDAIDSASYFSLGSMNVIADHNNQGFNRISDCVLGTSAYFVTENECLEFVCTASFDGHNTDSGLTNSDYVSIHYDNEGGITCYTCKENWQNIRVVFFQPKK